MQGMCHLSHGIVAPSLGIKTNTHIENALKHMHSFTQDLTCVLSETMHPASSTATEADDTKRFKLEPDLEIRY